MSLKSEKTSLNRRHLNKDLGQVRLCHVAVEEERALGRRDCKCQGPEARTCQETSKAEAVTGRLEK